ncbi:MAG: hypothetical protein HQL91_11115 [Magnetococcales bacterium]|nr:hypothetical protein [Magnetococcales bacterium]
MTQGIHGHLLFAGALKSMPHNQRTAARFSAHAFEREIQRSQEAGCDLYLTKPINKKKLMTVFQQIAEAMNQQSSSLADLKIGLYCGDHDTPGSD